MNNSYGIFASVYDLLTENVEYKKRADYFSLLFYYLLHFPLQFLLGQPMHFTPLFFAFLIYTRIKATITTSNAAIIIFSIFYPLRLFFSEIIAMIPTITIIATSPLRAEMRFNYDTRKN